MGFAISFSVVFLIAGMGCEGPLSPQARQLLQEGYHFYQAGRDAEAIEKLDRFLVDNAKSNRADEAYYLRGLAWSRQKDSAQAKSDFQAAVDTTQNVSLRAKAQVGLGDLAYQEDQMALAENLYRRALGDIEQGQEPSDHAHYRLGCVLQRQGRWAEADVQFDRVVYLFADSELAGLARRRTHSTAWTIQTGAFREKIRADRAAAPLRDIGLSAFTQPLLQDQRPLFVVQVGRFDTYEQAAASLSEVQKHQPDSFVITTR